MLAAKPWTSSVAGDEAERTGRVEVQPAHHKAAQTLTISSNTPVVKVGSLIRAWLPYPQEYRQQRHVKLISTSPEPRLVAPNGVDGNPVSSRSQRTMYFEEPVVAPARPLEFKEVFEYTSFAYYPKLDPAKPQPLPPAWNGACLVERPQRVGAEA